MIDLNPLLEAMTTVTPAINWRDEVNSALAQLGAKRLDDKVSIKRHHLLIAALSSPVIRGALDAVRKDSPIQLEQIANDIYGAYQASLTPTQPEATIKAGLE